jgi:hypothetical protein
MPPLPPEQQQPPHVVVAVHREQAAIGEVLSVASQQFFDHRGVALAVERWKQENE